MFKLGGVPRAVEMEHVTCGPLEVQTFRRGIGRHEDPDHLSGVIEGVLHQLTFDVIHTPEERQETIFVVPGP